MKIVSGIGKNRKERGVNDVGCCVVFVSMRISPSNSQTIEFPVFGLFLHEGPNLAYVYVNLRIENLTYLLIDLGKNTCICTVRILDYVRWITGRGTQGDFRMGF